MRNEQSKTSCILSDLMNIFVCFFVYWSMCYLPLVLDISHIHIIIYILPLLLLLSPSLPSYYISSFHQVLFFFLFYLLFCTFRMVPQLYFSICWVGFALILVSLYPHHYPVATTTFVLILLLTHTCIIFRKFIAMNNHFDFAPSSS